MPRWAPGILACPGACRSPDGTAPRRGGRCRATALPNDSGCRSARAHGNGRWPGADAPGATGSLATPGSAGWQRCGVGHGVLPRGRAARAARAGSPSATRRICRHVWRDLRRGGSVHLQLCVGHASANASASANATATTTAGAAWRANGTAASGRRWSCPGRQAGRREPTTVTGSTHSSAECGRAPRLDSTGRRARCWVAPPLAFARSPRIKGTALHDYRPLEAATGVPFSFATPRHSRERGTNGNPDGLLRQNLPGGTSLVSPTQTRGDVSAQTPNPRSRKRHACQTPETCFNVALQS